MDNIVLIGMPGAGKSTSGVVLAKVLGYQFIDTDLLIQQKEEKLLSEIIQEEGIDRFLEIEEEVNSKVNAKNSVIATGGSVVYGPRAMEHLRSIGIVIYIHVSYDIIRSRLDNIQGRGVVLNDGQTLESLYKERELLYKKYANIMVDQKYGNVEDTVKDMVIKLNKIY